ncbi:MAG: glycoside hydrolase family 9 protein, partial [Bacteroidales bacterium]
MKNYLALIWLFFITTGHSQSLTETIRLNQVGYYTASTKKAVVVNTTATSFDIKTADRSKTVYTGTLGEARTWTQTSESIKTIDFTDFRQAGTYVIEIQGVGYSYPFTISSNALKEAAKASIKYFYFNRCSYELKPEFAGIFSRPAGHPDTKVQVCDNNFSTGRPVGTIFSSPGGWYDAGDYNKYLLTAGISTYTLLSLYEQYPEYISTLTLNIPESKNKIPDLLDECIFEIRWVLTMQDTDGGVYTKLTNTGFGAMNLMPKEHGETMGIRYVCRKNTSASLQFVALLASAYRILAPIDKEIPGLRDSCLNAAKKAWDWCRINSNIAAGQCACNIQTGGYGDSDFNDEWMWAASEMYLATNNIDYYNAVNIASASLRTPSWPSGKEILGYMSLLLNKHKLTGKALTDVVTLENKFKNQANVYVSYYNNGPYSIVKTDSYPWGNNGDAGNQSFVLLTAYKLFKDARYLEAGLSNVDYILGKNPVSYSFLTGYGSKISKVVHHRISVADGIAQLPPGMVLGGIYQSAANFQEDIDNYAMTEVAINWNAPVAFAITAIDAIYSQDCVKPNLGKDISLCDAGVTLPITLDAGIASGSFKWFKNGVIIDGKTSSKLVISEASEASGIFKVIRDSASCLQADEIQLSNELPKPFLGNDLILIEGKTVTLDAGISGAGYIYNWYKNDELIENEKSQTLIVNQCDAIYSVSVHTTNCSEKRDTITILCSKAPSALYTATPPVIDGKKDNIWVSSEFQLTNCILGTCGTSDLAASWQLLWDETNLYIFVDVTDDAYSNDSRNWWDDDGIEIFIDGDNSKRTQYDKVNDFQWGFKRGSEIAFAGGNNPTNSLQGLEFKITDHAIGYYLEAKIPWTKIGTTPLIGTVVGFDVAINDDDNSGGRDSKIAWGFTTDDAWQNLSIIGEITLIQKNTSSETQTINLEKGWNLISFYVYPDDKSIQNIFKDINFVSIKNNDGFYQSDLKPELNSL